MTGVGSWGWHHYRYAIPVLTTNKWGTFNTVSYIYIFQISNAWGKASTLMKWLKEKNHVKSEITIYEKDEIK